jgi:hypothetical protein
MMTSKLFIMCEIVVAVCGLGLVAVGLTGWEGRAANVSALMFGVVMFLAGGSAATLGMVQRQRGERSDSYDS